MRQCECAEMRLFSLFLLARPPLAGSSSVCLLELVPRPRAWDALAGGRFAVAGGNRFACFESCHSALSLPLVRCCCSVRLRAACFDCPVPCDLPRLIDCPFLIKAFQRMRCPAVLPVAVSWRLRPHHLAHHLGWRHRLLRSSMSSPLCRLIVCVQSSSRAVVPSSHPSSRAICLLAALRPVSRYAARLASRLAPRPVLPWVMSSPSCPIALPCRSACGHRSPRPACRLGWERDGTGAPLSPLPARPAAAACPGWRGAASVPIAASCLLACGCCHLCLYCDGEIVYMICPIAII